MTGLFLNNRRYLNAINLEKVKASQKFYRDNNKEKIKEYNLKWWQENKQRLVAVKYKLTLEQYRQMIANSDGICAICGLEMTFDAKCQSQACVDHDHNTGKIRELICSRCNLMIGKAEDSIDILNKAILYLKKHKDCPWLKVYLML